MKKLLTCLLSILLLLSMSGCQRQNDSNSHTFYYPRNDFGYDALEGKFYEEIIRSEIRDDFTDTDIYEILRMHLEGPISPDFANPYPDGMSLITCNVEEQTLYITVSDHLSELTDINLIIACACIGKTGIELTNTSTVQISCENALLDGKKSVVLQNDLIIVSDTVSNNAPEQE